MDRQLQSLPARHTAGEVATTFLPQRLTEIVSCAPAYSPRLWL